MQFIYSISKIHLEFVSAIEVAVIVDDDLNYCGRTDNNSHFCNTCYSIIVKKQISKFRSANYINVLPCRQTDSDIFSDLTSIKAVFITCVYLNKTGSTVSYHQIQGYMVVLPQNSGLLLTILLLSNLTLYDVIYIAWARKRLHIAFDICLFASIQRTRILEILHWLKTNNSLYKNIVINLNLLHP